MGPIGPVAPKPSPTGTRPGTRKPYMAPALREYGPLRDLTAGGSGVMSEFPDMNMNRFP